MRRSLTLLALAFAGLPANAQPGDAWATPAAEHAPGLPAPEREHAFARNARLLRGGDLSYVPQMEDCGAVFTVDGRPEDPYRLFRNHGGDVVRLRLWHTPSWQDSLHPGRRYGDLAEVERAIDRAHAAGMAVLLDLHLSDTWADPNRQLAPAAWRGVLDDTAALGDSLAAYVGAVLDRLARRGRWPEALQLGNEVNRGILLSPEANASWTLAWDRNAALFRRGLAAIRAAERRHGRRTMVLLHLAGPAAAEDLLRGFTEHGVTDFDAIGLSYYWAWHRPTTIAETAEVIRVLRRDYGVPVWVVETGYPWTDGWNDEAANIISALHPDYAPASPDAQFRWMRDLGAAVAAAGGSAVLYWEPFWVSTPCRTPWGRGSHQEHATFFDFSNERIPDGGLRWLAAPGPTVAPDTATLPPWRVAGNAQSGRVRAWRAEGLPAEGERCRVLDGHGAVLREAPLPAAFDLTPEGHGTYRVEIRRDGRTVYAERWRFGEG